MGKKCKLDITNLNKAIENLEKLKTHHAEIGVYGGVEPTTGSSLITVGSVHEFGNDINPPRSFLRYPCTLYRDKIRQSYANALKANLYVANGWEKTLRAVCFEGEDIVQESFDTGGYGSWANLKAATIMKKGSNAILIQTGHLRNSITTKITSNEVN